ncbi:hypothetical protein DFH09DRAFT_1077841 [Mycena vulgaris]|nr:hypothetical protein DFH09DRAFT_1077841 [Mycena vulgaris]
MSAVGAGRVGRSMLNTPRPIPLSAAIKFDVTKGLPLNRFIHAVRGAETQGEKVEIAARVSAPSEGARERMHHGGYPARAKGPPPRKSPLCVTGQSSIGRTAIAQHRFRECENRKTKGKGIAYRESSIEILKVLNETMPMMAAISSTTSSAQIDEGAERHEDGALEGEDLRLVNEGLLEHRRVDDAQVGGDVLDEVCVAHGP